MQIGSEEEKSDLVAAYLSSKGDLEFILMNIMCSTHEDEERFISLINSSIASGLLTSTPNWKKASKDTKAKSKRAEKAGKEALEAEEYAKELGVHDKLYGTSAKPKNNKGKGKAKASGEDDVESLRALIQAKQVGRMDSIIGSIEAKYAKKEAEKDTKKGKGKKRGEPEVEPSEEEFQKMQEAVEARRTSGGNGSKKRKST